MGEIHQYQHQQPPQQSQPQLQPVFEQRQQQKFMTEQLATYSFFSHFNIQYNNNNNNNYHQQQQQQQTFQQFQNLQTNPRGGFPSHQHFHLQLEQQQRRLQQENDHNQNHQYHHHYQQPSCSSDNNNNNNQNNNFRGFITGGSGSSSSVGIPIPSIPLDLNGNGRCRNDNDVTTSLSTSLVRPSHFWRTLNTDIYGDRRNKSGDYINEADENDKGGEYHNHNYQPEMNQTQNYGYDDHDDGVANGKSCGRYFCELEALFGNTSTSSPAAIISLPPPPQPPISDEFIINHLNAKKAGKQVAEEEVEQEMLPSRHDHHKKKKKRSRERYEEMVKLIQTLVKRFMNQQEILFTKFTEKIEKLDKESKEREECWRRREMENLHLEFSVFPKSHIENRALLAMAPPTTTTTTRDDSSIVAQTIPTEKIILNGKGSSSSSKRWPDEEVDALIQQRMNLAERFQEPGLKWPLWQEISNRMSSMGFHQRDAKRCKEKWDNINKYFRKYREQGRRQKMKTCVYFDKLDQLYNSNSNSIINGGCYGGGEGNVDVQQIQREEISVKKTDVRLVGIEEEVEVEWDELDSRF